MQTSCLRKRYFSHHQVYFSQASVPENDGFGRNYDSGTINRLLHVHEACQYSLFLWPLLVTTGQFHLVIVQLLLTQLEVHTKAELNLYPFGFCLSNDFFEIILILFYFQKKSNLAISIPSSIYIFLLSHGISAAVKFNQSFAVIKAFFATFRDPIKISNQFRTTLVLNTNILMTNYCSQNGLSFSGQQSIKSLLFTGL